MTDLTGKKIANTYKDLLQINSSASNSGVDGTLRRIQDGGGNNSAISLSQNEAKVHGNLAVTGNVSADSINLNGIDVSAINAVEVSATRINATSITTDKLDATTLVFQDVSVSSLRAGTVSATTLAATTNITLAGDNVATSASLAATSAELRGAIVSIESIISSNVAYVSAAQVSVLAVIQGMQNNISTNSTHINTVSATLSATDDRLKTSIANVSAALETRIAAVSAEVSAVKALVTATNASAIAANTSAISVNSAAITSINAAISAGAYASAETSVNLETRVANLSSTMATSIDNSNAAITSVNTRINAVSVLAETKASASTSANLETRINAVSILAETKASASTSVNLETRINAVSILAETKASASTSVNLETRINAVSANLVSTSAALESHINTVSASLSSTNTSVAANASAIAVNSAAITSVNTRINAVSVLAETKASASTSVNLETRINAVSAITKTNADAITSINTAISAGAYASASTSVNLETRINAVSILAETKASASTSANVQTQIATLSATMAASIATLSATMATSIDNQMPKAGGTFTGAVTFNNEGFTVSSTASAVFNGPARFNSSINLGNSSGDLISTTGRFSGDLIPNSTTGRDLGTDSLRWDNAYINTLRGGINAIGTSVTDLIYPSAYGNAPANVNYVTSAVATKASAGTSATLETRIAGVSSTMATSISNHLPLSGGTLTGALTLNADPTANLGAATKQYVDNLTAAGIHLHDAVRVETPSALTATYDNGTAGVGATLTNSGTQAALSIDGITLSTSDRVLVRQQSNQAHNGVYVVTNVGSASTNWILTRSDDADSAGDGSPDTLDEGSYFFVTEGDTGAGDAYVCNTQGTITFGTTNITFAKFSDSLEYTAGTGININASRVIATSGVATTTQLAALSATLATSIANVSALIPTSLTELNISDGTNGQVLQTDGSSNFTFVSIAGGGGSGTMTELKAGTNIALIENGTTVTETTTSATINVVGVASAGTSTALETRIASTSANLETRINAVSVLAETKASASTSANLETRINAVSVLAETKASASTSVNLETRINAVSVLAETKASASTSVNLETRIAAVSATMATSISNSNTAIATLSATMATSISNFVPKSGDVTKTDNLTLSDTLTLTGGQTGGYPQLALTASGSTNACYIQLGDAADVNVGQIEYNHADNSMRFTTNAAERARLEADGDWHADGNVVAYSTTISDKRLKKDIQTIENALWRVKQLNGCTFTYLKDDRKSAGLIAQDVEKVLPSAVIDTEAVFHGEEGETYKTLQYDQVIGLLVEAVKELAAKVEELENASSR